MTDEIKTIGLCLAQAHTFLKTDLINELDRAAGMHGYRVLAFNSSLDYYWSQKGDHTTACVYDLIPYNQLSALVILHDNIYDLPLQNKMVEKAREQHIPVFYLGGVRDDCVSIVDDYEEAYKALVRHVVRDHGIRDTYYIAGLKNEDNSMRRLRYYREVLEENGVAYSEENVAYGNYLETVASDIAQHLIDTRPSLPRAILCANDSMASAVCDTLKANGFRVPRDVVVTGFDGTPTAYLVQPQLSTCHSNPEELADLIADLTDRFHAGETLQSVYSHPYKTVIAESCGCPSYHHDRYNALHTFRQAEALFNHENVTYYAIEQLMAMKEQIEILHKLSALLLPNSVLYINRSLLESDPSLEYHANAIEDELIMIPYRKPNHQLIFQKVYRKDIPLPVTAPKGVTLLNTIHAETLVCGYYAAYSSDYAADAQLVKRLSDLLNLIFSIFLSRKKQRQLLAKLENNLYIDPRTGMMNLRGLKRWFSQYVADESNRRRPLALSVYAIPHYSYLFETYGMEEIESVSKQVAAALQKADPRALALARLNEEQYVIVDSVEDASGLSAVINSTAESFFRQIESRNTEGNAPYNLEVNCGCTTLDAGWGNASLENLIRLATGEMYLNRMQEGGLEDAARTQIDPELFNSFRLLIEKNLFRFYFQPIIDAHTGQIYAYEALMRTDEAVHLNPLEVLSAARECNRQYEVERATLFGVIDRYVRGYTDFHGRKVFINTIPGHFLNSEDSRVLRNRYEKYLDNIVLELTEDEPTSDDELEQMKKLCRAGGQMQIAIDDFGTGHSNIVNLLRYSPQIIKIDRALISGIEHDNNRQLFVRNTIEFAHQNGILVLAEGVETSDELRTVIDFGVDLIQGFYTGRPAPQPLDKLDDKLKNEILRENLDTARYDNAPMTYTLRNGEMADIIELGLRKITCVQAGSGAFTLSGSPGQNVDMLLRVADYAEAVITLNRVNMRGATEPTVVLGHHSRVTLILKGQNTLTKEGIVVPPTASLTIQGDGSLHINNSRNDAAGIGARYNDPYGTITLDVNGKITFVSTGDRMVCLGGGRSAGEGIRLLRGTYELNGKGINVVCLGSSLGDTSVEIGDVNLTAYGEGNEVLLIGSVSGTAAIRSSGRLNLSTACERAVGIGTLTGLSKPVFSGGSVNADIKCYSGVVIGSYSGIANIACRNTVFRLHGEGTQVAGLGSLMGEAETAIESGDVRGELRAGEQMLLGNQQSRCVITGGNFQLTHDPSVCPVGPAGEPLVYLTPPGDRYAKIFSDAKAVWTYTASRNADGHLGVFVPQA